MINCSALYTLILDSSLKKSCLLLCKNHQILFFKVYSTLTPSSTLLSSHLDEALKKINIRAQDIGQIACGHGPGSYTGIRVAISIAKALGFALNIPVQGFCALQAIEPLKSPAQGARVIDARSGGIFAIEEGDKEAKKVSCEDINAWLQKTPQILTPHPQILREKFSSLQISQNNLESIGPAPTILEADFCPNSLLERGLKALKANEKVLSPIYLGKGHSLP